MKENVGIRKACLEDIEKLNTLVNSAYRGESSKKGWTTEADLLGGQRIDQTTLGNIISKNELGIFILEIDGELKACVDLEDKKMDYLYLGMLTVDPVAQGLGLAKILLNFCFDQAKKLSKKKIKLTVINKRHELIEYYQRRGFVMTGKREVFPAYEDENFGIPKCDDLELLEMEKIL